MKAKHMKPTLSVLAAALAIAASCVPGAMAAVSADEAAQLKTRLTPLGGERAGNKDGSIPEWEGGFKGGNARQGGRRTDPFANEKPLYVVTAQNLAQYATRLSEGQQAMFKKYPGYRMEVYPTHRTAQAPQWVYDNTLANATRAKTVNNGFAVEGAYGGVPFPIPKTGQEAMWNHNLRWQGEAYRSRINTWITTADGKKVQVSDSVVDIQMPYYYKEGSLDSYKKEPYLLRLVTNGPAQKAGEALLIRDPMDPVAIGRQSWQYLTGQRRVRKLPNAAYDTPSFVTSGVSNFDEIYVFSGAMDRYDWKLVGKREMLIPYNANKIFAPAKDSDAMAERHLNPEHVRWELHRVWEVEATLAAGKRHVIPKRRFYLDEDTWLAVLADGWDAKGQLWKTFWYLPIVAPDVPAVMAGPFGHYNLQSGDWIANNMMNEKPEQISVGKRQPESYFTPDALAGEGVR
ncbi:DUF1329 domain-containing protein [Duganella sp. FT92W]|uniref:DUF1329 domain-containing protein n=2 Tax=Pseudoduganella rivuli TaxID=2666085 RepID=A0A7X2LPN0_9BURK|nr:DUF1329 domain-containing protein [Pseudoduganella rivuli]